MIYKDLYKERAEMIEHIQNLNKILSERVGLPGEYIEQLHDYIKFWSEKLYEIDKMIIEVTSVKEVDNRTTRRANKNK